MQSTTIVCFAVLMACASAQVFVRPGHKEEDLAWMRSMGRGHVFGTLGSTDGSLVGKLGYKQNIFNDHRGNLGGTAYGSRVINEYGGTSSFGGKLDWKNANDNARASLDVHKQVGGSSGMTLTGDGVWKLDSKTRLVAGGNLDKTFGHSKPEVGIQAKIEHDFK
ncbi:unnamed protein product [Chrysodeixis includens]|uniref:Gloverin n=1 Tax=Chrysodeixis includens TaxID=689277 RepID=A0A9N8L5Q0_CHRIL|nr:unnamed protein product [Chrysodeixis includens]